MDDKSTREARDMTHIALLKRRLSHISDVHGQISSPTQNLLLQKVGAVGVFTDTEALVAAFLTVPVATG